MLLHKRPRRFNISEESEHTHTETLGGEYVCVRENVVRCLIARGLHFSLSVKRAITHRVFMCLAITINPLGSYLLSCISLQFHCCCCATREERDGVREFLAAASIMIHVGTASSGTVSIGPSLNTTASPNAPQPSPLLPLHPSTPATTTSAERDGTTATVHVRRDMCVEAMQPLLMLGCAAVGGIYHKAWSRDDVVKVLRRAILVHGIRALDTAPWYGCGKSELDIGAAIDTLVDDNNRNGSDGASSGCSELRDIAIFTKVGRVTIDRRLAVTCAEGCTAEAVATAAQLGIDAAAFSQRCKAALARDTCYAINDDTRDLICVEACSSQGVQRSWKDSAKRLGSTASALVRSLRLHDADTDELFQEAIACPGGALHALPALLPHNEGGNVSLGLNDADVALRFLWAADKVAPQPQRQPFFSSIMIAGCWNLLDQSALPLLLECQRRSIDVHLGGVFAAGYLWGGPCYRYAKPQGAEAAKLEAQRTAWTALAASFGISLACAALQFALLPSCVRYAAIGCSTEVELDDTVSLMADFLPVDAFLRLVATAGTAGLLRQDVVAALLNP